MVSPHATLKVLQFPASFLGARAQPSSKGACQCVNLQRAVAGRVALSDEGAAKLHSLPATVRECARTAAVTLSQMISQAACGEACMNIQ